jgi:hypothetical protein
MRREVTSRWVGEVIHSLAGALGDVVSAAGGHTLSSLAYVLGVEVPGNNPPQRDWWRRFEIISGTNPVVEHETLLSFIAAESPRGLTRSGGNPVRTLELLFAILDEAEDKELAGRIRRHLKKHGITRDSVEVAAARPLPEVVIGKGKAGPGRGKKTADQISRLSYGTGSSYLAARLARDHAGLAAEVEAGRMSLRVAAKEAGIVKPPDPGRRLVKSWAAATPEQRAAFVNDHAEELRRMLEKGRS